MTQPRHVSLREFQEHLAEKLRSARHDKPVDGLLGVESGGERWLVSLAESGEVVPLSDLAAVPLTKAWFMGIANVRGALYSVVDFSAFRGGPPTPRTSQARLLLIGAHSEMHCALLVTRTLGLKDPRAMQFSAADPGWPAWCAQTATDADGVEWRMLRPAALLAAPDFLAVGVQTHAA